MTPELEEVVSKAYYGLEDASLELQDALVRCDGPAVAEATRRVAIMRSEFMDVVVNAHLEPESKGHLNGLIQRLNRINEGNLVLIRRRVSYLRQLRKEFNGLVGTVGYGSDGGSVTNINRRDNLDELA